MPRKISPEGRAAQVVALKAASQKRSQAAYEKTQAALERMKKQETPSPSPP